MICRYDDFCRKTKALWKIAGKPDFQIQLIDQTAFDGKRKSITFLKFEIRWCNFQFRLLIIFHDDGFSHITVITSRNGDRHDGVDIQYLIVYRLDIENRSGTSGIDLHFGRRFEPCSVIGRDSKSLLNGTATAPEQLALNGRSIIFNNAVPVQFKNQQLTHIDITFRFRDIVVLSSG
ncbi:hypothetical protein SDC9_149055 [bioreactor metagenome]|uniref:Uncharacterized protein n=1 Tax=bioreactor metagenome TaxID=1076179 RepID=A0A645EMT3_9ZZZZ